MLRHNWAAAQGAVENASAGSGSGCRCHGATFGWKVTWADLTDRHFYSREKKRSITVSHFQHFPKAEAAWSGVLSLTTVVWRLLWARSAPFGPPQPGKISLSVVKCTSKKQANKNRAIGKVVKVTLLLLSQRDSQTSQVLWKLYALTIRLQRSVMLSCGTRGRCRGIMKLWRSLQGRTKQNGCGRSQWFSNKLRLKQMNGERYTVERPYTEAVISLWFKHI